MFEQLSLFEDLTLDGKIKRSIDVIKLAAEMSEHYYKKPLLVCYSGGKDSDVLLDIAKRANISFEVMHSLTTVDAPPTVQHIKAVFKELQESGIKAEIKKPTDKDGNPVSMWRLIPARKMPPTRRVRYCCAVLKEASTPSRFVCLGVRRSESSKRATRKEFEVPGLQTQNAIRYDFEHVFENYEISLENEGQKNAEVWDCKIISNAKGNNDLICNPLIYWNDADVWEYAERFDVEMNPLYNMGYSRVGCVGCPMGGGDHQKREFEDFPVYRKNYIKAFERMIQERKKNGLSCQWETGEEVMNWWVGDQIKEPETIEGQETLFEEV